MSDVTRPARFGSEELLAHADWARGLAAHLVRDPSEADDLVQDALVSAIRRPPLADRPLRPWLAAVLRKLALARRRGEGRRVRREAIVGSRGGHAPSAADIAGRLDAHRVLAETVADLPEPLRGTIYLRYYEGMDSAEIGLRQGVAAATVRWRLARALGELRARLDARSKGGRHEWLAALAPIATPRPLPSAVGPTSSPAEVAGAVSGVLAMATMTKFLICGAAAVALFALAWTTRVVDLGGPRSAPGRETPRDVPRTDPTQPPRRDVATRAPRQRASAESATLVPDDATTAGDDPTPEKAASGRLEVRARVIDSSGAVAVGARVEFGAGASCPGADGDVEGRASFRVDVGTATSLDFVVSAVRCATRIVTAAPPRSGGVLDLGDVRLGAGGSVTGRVIEGDRPLDGVSVGVLTVGGGGATVIDEAPVARSDADGRFTLRGVAVGTQQISFDKAGFKSVVNSVEVRAGEEAPVHVVRLERADPTVRVRGLVQTPEGAPAAGAVVSFRYEGHGGTGSGSATADDAGRFDIEGGKDKAWRLSARDVAGAWSSAPTAEVRSGAEGVVLRLTKTRWAEVAATRADGTPVERFSVELLAPDGLRLDRSSDEAHAGGVARFKVPADRFALVLTAPGCAVATVGPIEPTSVESRIDVRVTELPGLSGRVMASGMPVAGARITLRKVVRPGMREIRNGFACSTAATFDAGVEADADGSFNLTLREAGRFVLRAEAPDLAPAEAGPFDLDPAVGRSGIEIAATQGGGIEGRVLVAAGRGVDGIIVGISRGDGEARTLRTGPDGAFRFDRLTPGPWLVRQVEREIRPGLSTVMSTVGEARFEWSCSVADGAVTHHDLDLRVEPSGAVRGDLRIDGSGAAGWRVALLAGTGLLTSEQTTSGKVGENGEYRLVAPRAGDYLVKATSPKGLTVFAPIQLGDAEVPLGVELRTGNVNVRGAAPGEPLALLWEESGGRCALAEAAIDAAGSCGPTQFPAGRVRLVRAKFEEPDPRAWTTVAEGVLAAGTTLTLDVPAK